MVQPPADPGSGHGLGPLPALAAGASWVCPACGESRRGFAFPFGRCPACDAALDRPPGDSPALDALRCAFEIELGGRAFYQRAATETGDATLRGLFRRFAVMEGEHMEALSQRYGLALPDPSPAFRLATAAVHAGIAAAPQDADALFRIAIALEQRAAAYFGAHATALPPGSSERRLYEELAVEER
jgi:glutamate synthase (NADPH/NADH) small chain